MTAPISLDGLTDAVMESIYDLWDRRFAELLGLRPSNAAVCPLVAAGKRCRSGYAECICERHWAVLDHKRIWLDKDGRHVFTAEPYNAEGHQMAAFLADLEQQGLHVYFTGNSPWNRGSTFLMIITAADQA